MEPAKYSTFLDTVTDQNEVRNLALKNCRLSQHFRSAVALALVVSNKPMVNDTKDAEAKVSVHVAAPGTKCTCVWAI